MYNKPVVAGILYGFHVDFYIYIYTRKEGRNRLHIKGFHFCVKILNLFTCTDSTEDGGMRVQVRFITMKRSWGSIVE